MVNQRSSPNAFPPSELDGAKVLEHARVDDEVIFTGQLNLFANDKKIGPVPRLAICIDENEELLLVHCDAEWGIVAIQAWNTPEGPTLSTVDEVKLRAETFYQGISSKWIAAKS